VNGDEVFWNQERKTIEYIWFSYLNQKFKGKNVFVICIESGQVTMLKFLYTMLLEGNAGKKGVGILKFYTSLDLVSNLEESK